MTVTGRDTYVFRNTEQLFGKERTIRTEFKILEENNKIMTRNLHYKNNMTKHVNRTSHPHFIAHYTGQRPHTAQPSYHQVDYIPNYSGHIHNTTTVYGLSLSRPDFKATLSSTKSSNVSTITETDKLVSEYSFSYPPKTRNEKYFNTATLLASKSSPYEKRLEQLNKIQTALLRNTSLDPYKQSNKRPKSGYAGHIPNSVNLYK